MQRILILLSLLIASLAKAQWPYYKGALQLNDSTFLEVNFTYEQMGNAAKVTFVNGPEKIIATEVTQQKDSVFIRMPVFDSEFRLKRTKNSFSGNWYNYSRKEKNVIPFTAKEFHSEAGPMCGFCSHINGKWEATFSPGTKDSSAAIGVFKGNAHWRLDGTFLTETGDYRYLEGPMWKDSITHRIKFNLQAFDGSHAFLFTGKLNEKENEIKGMFYSGAHHAEPWTAKENENARLRDADKIITVTNDNAQLNFSFPDLNGKNVSIKDIKFKNKVVIVQLMGSWCPNCMDESKYLSAFYDKNKSLGLEVIAVAFEKAGDPKKAAANVKRLRDKFGIKYTMLVTGLTGKQNAANSFPMLSGIDAFPTTLYIDRKGKIRKVYSGFYGPATGEEHEKFKQEHEAFIKLLLNEK